MEKRQIYWKVYFMYRSPNYHDYDVHTGVSGRSRQAESSKEIIDFFIYFFYRD